MIYNNIRRGKFINRPNRFIANIEINGVNQMCHVKNTGRCKELLTDNAKVFIQKFDNPKRKTKYDLISVYKGDRLINIDSQAPNKIFNEWVENSGLFENITLIKPEYTYGNSRFDFYIETVEKKVFVEVKGVTLEENSIAMFPDAPTLRGLKHVNELMKAIDDGYEAYIVFIVQMKDVDYFVPNIKTHMDFGEALVLAQKKGVKILAVDCEVTENSVEARNFVEVRLR
jgi:sugar fermentation stimulation protein A